VTAEMMRPASIEWRIGEIIQVKGRSEWGQHPTFVANNNPPLTIHSCSRYIKSFEINQFLTWFLDALIVR